ncbi:decapping and exoribonuclease protein-like [Anneissia japonica]|uniref:decapping and exoribonuclease protein-like n=1 Tax=Anneissia japonica TaxID=1529436 RepID=UPI001425794B|nr:decapping and exoribonuclease protein-like [Anneissia japonica]XP_033108438.1 decapping and exoribonuclease protein-like [Anneissia japonica]XP_033108439.1 decapping and exoribonuclease protein-like [Anneissia japonica]
MKRSIDEISSKNKPVTNDLKSQHNFKQLDTSTSGGSKNRELESRSEPSNESNPGKSECAENMLSSDILQIQPISRFNGKFPFFRQPMEVGCFSLDRDRKLYLDTRMLKYLYDTREISVRFDLQHGFDVFEKRDDDVKERLNNLMQWILGMKKHFQLDPKEVDENGSPKLRSLNTDFIAWRGHITKILCTPYEQREGWMMAVTLFHGTYYISEVETKENEARRKNMSDREKEMTYWGYKFEQYMTSVDGRQEPNTNVPVNNSEAYCSVIRTRLNKHSLIYSGEVDCCVNDPNLRPPANYIELKTNRILYAPNNKRNFHRYKLLKWWAQSFLIGIPTVIGGFRDDEGNVLQLERFSTFRMPEIARQERSWSASVCVNFCDYFLNYVKSQVTRDDPRVVYLFERKPGSDEITYTIEEDPVHHFMPEWYIKCFTQ